MPPEVKCRGGDEDQREKDSAEEVAGLRAKIGAPRRRREEDAIHLFTTERTFDAIAQGELRDLGLNQEVVLEAMVDKLASALA